MLNTRGLVFWGCLAIASFCFGGLYGLGFVAVCCVIVEII